jgi:membrane associated rhomboid family serine protease
MNASKPVASDEGEHNMRGPAEVGPAGNGPADVRSASSGRADAGPPLPGPADTGPALPGQPDTGPALPGRPEVGTASSGQVEVGPRVGGSPARGRIGLRRFPLLTLAVFGITAVTNALQFVLPDLLPALQRTPGGLHGQWWRSATALLVQDGGVFGVLATLAFLLVLGALAEQVLGRPAWLVCYLGGAAVGELAGYAWQPYGAGKSVAVCGLAGALIVAALRADDRLPVVAMPAVLYWCGAVLAGLSPVGLVAGVLAGVATQLALGRGLPVARPAAALGIVAAAVLVAASDIHGAALAAGIAIAALLAAAGRSKPSVS